MARNNWPDAYYQLPPHQQKLLERISGEMADGEFEHQAMLQSLLRPGNEAAFLVRYFGVAGSGKLHAGLADFHMRLIKTALYVPRGLVLFPANHGKTTIVSGLLPILAAVRDPNIRIVLLAKNDDEGSGIGKSIMAELTENDLLVKDFGPFRPAQDDVRRPWRDNWFSVAMRDRIAKEPTFAIFGSGAKNILGHRTDWVICDDVVTEKNSSTPEQRDKMQVWFETSVETSPEKQRPNEIAGRITVVGTMFHPKDLYYIIDSKVDRNGKRRYKCHREDAIKDEVGELPLWPERYSWADLMDYKADIGTLSFNKRFRNRPVDESQQFFKEDWIRGRGGKGGCLDYYRTMGEVEENWRIFQGFDPAVGTSRTAKFCGQVLFGVPGYARDQRLIIFVGKSQMTLPQQRDSIIAKHRAYPNMSMSVIEVNAYQKGLYQAVHEKCEELGVTLNVQPYTTGKNKLDPEIGVAMIATLLEHGKLRFPYGDDSSRKMSELLINELIDYPFHPTDDLIMALWFALVRANTALPQYKTFNRIRPQSRYHQNRVQRNPIFMDQTVGAGAHGQFETAPDDLSWGRALDRVDMLDNVPLPEPDESVD